jgi:hypothetical protein
MEALNYPPAEDGSASYTANPYLIDVSLLKKPTNVSSDKELEVEVTKICETLKDTCKHKDYL